MPKGQFLGSKSKYIYKTDSDKTILLRLDDDLVLTGSGLAVADPANPPTDVIGKFDRFRPRGVYWEATAVGFEGKRKFIVCGQNTASLYTEDASQAITIDGVAGVTTGKRGESYTL